MELLQLQAQLFCWVFMEEKLVPKEAQKGFLLSMCV